LTGVLRGSEAAPYGFIILSNIGPFPISYSQSRAFLINVGKGFHRLRSHISFKHAKSFRHTKPPTHFQTRQPFRHAKSPITHSGARWMWSCTTWPLTCHQTHCSYSSSLLPRLVTSQTQDQNFPGHTGKEIGTPPTSRAACICGSGQPYSYYIYSRRTIYMWPPRQRNWHKANSTLAMQASRRCFQLFIATVRFLGFCTRENRSGDLVPGITSSTTSHKFLLSHLQPIFTSVITSTTYLHRTLPCVSHLQRIYNASSHLLSHLQHIFIVPYHAYHIYNVSTTYPSHLLSHLQRIYNVSYYTYHIYNVSTTYPTYHIYNVSCYHIYNVSSQQVSNSNEQGDDWLVA